MTVEEITQEMVNPERIIEPQRMALIVDYISGWVIDKELELLELDIQLHNHWNDLKKNLYIRVGSENKTLTNREVDIELKMSDQYKRYMECKLTLSRLRSYRETLKRRLAIIGIGRKF